MLTIRKSEYPSKQDVNLVLKERTINSPSRAIPAFILFLVCLSLFIRFGVQNQLDKMNTAQAALSEARSERNSYLEYNRDYEEIKERYSQYFEDYLNDEESRLSDRLGVLDLLEHHVMAEADLSSITIQDNVCRISITDVPLNTISKIVANLEESPNVLFISVSTAATQDNEDGQIIRNVTANVTITLTGGQTDDTP